jgi:hypothetical protein
MLLAGRFDAEVFVGKSGSDAASTFRLYTHVRSFPNFDEEGIMRAQLTIFRFPLK